MAKSTESSADIPQTPFIDVFRVESVPGFEQRGGGSDDDSDYSSDSEAFAYDSPVALGALRSINGSRH